MTGGIKKGGSNAAAAAKGAKLASAHAGGGYAPPPFGVGFPPSWPPNPHGAAARLVDPFSMHVPARKPFQNCAMHVYIAHFIDFTQQESLRAMMFQQDSQQHFANTVNPAAAYFAAAAAAAGGGGGSGGGSGGGGNGDGDARGATEGLGTSGVGQFPPMGAFPPMVHPHALAAMMSSQAAAAAVAGQFGGGAPVQNGGDGALPPSAQAQMNHFMAFMMQQAQFGFPGGFPGAAPGGMPPFMFPPPGIPAMAHQQGGGGSDIGEQTGFFPPPFLDPNNPIAAMMMAGVPPHALMEMMQQAAVGEGPQQQQQQRQQQQQSENGALAIKQGDAMLVKQEQDAMETDDKNQSVVNVQNGASDAKTTLTTEISEATGTVEVAAS